MFEGTSFMYESFILLPGARVEKKEKEEEKSKERKRRDGNKRTAKEISN